MQLTLITEVILLLLLLLLLLTTGWDIIKHIIPNIISLAIFLCGITFHFISNGWEGGITAMSGLLVGFFIFIPFYIAGGMAAGDVKLMAAVGTLLGPFPALLASGLSLITGSVLALIIVLFKGDLLILLKRYFQIIKTYFFTNQLIYQKPQTGEAAAIRFPYALAISTGTVLALAHQSQLNFYNFKSLFNGGVL